MKYYLTMNKMGTNQVGVSPAGTECRRSRESEEEDKLASLP